jgi:hypothetical protein
MRILRPQPDLPEHPPAPVQSRTGAGEAALDCRVRLPDGRLFVGALSPARHRALQLGLLHTETGDLVELTPGVRPPGGPLALDRRPRPEHYLPGGASGRTSWLEALLNHAEQIVNARTPLAHFPMGRARRRLSGSRAASGRAATRMPSRSRAFSGSTSTGPAGCRRCGHSSLSGRATC